MLISYRWLARHVDLAGIAPERLAEDLTLSTCEVEGCERFAPHLSDVVVGHVLERARHPDADKLSVCKVDVGGGEPLQIVCGAPNVAAGQRVAVATVGTVLPGDLKIKKSRIRGVDSCGMICSVRELALGDEHDGIWVLAGEPAIGRPVAEALGYEDWVLEVDNKSLTHRPDLWGHRGLAGEVAAIYRRALVPLDLSPPAVGAGPAPALRVESPACSRYLALAIDGLAPERSPEWLRMLLLAVGQRPIDLVVDLSNFVMLDLGQPNHAFDRSRLGPDGIVVRQARAGERITTLDGVERALEPSDLVIASGGVPVALAGIMGGAGSKVEGDTSRLLLEVATFQPAVVRRTSARLGLRTDSSARFEKHLDPTLPAKALAHYARLLRELQPKVSFPLAVSDAGDWSDPARTLVLRPERVRQALGAAVPDDEQADLLSRLGFSVRRAGARLEVGVPSARATKDVTIEQDLIEEIGRLYRYGNVPEATLSGELLPPAADARRRLVRRVQDRLAGGARFHEVLSYSFQEDRLIELLGLLDAPFVEVQNPVVLGQSKVRRDVLPSLIALLEPNRRQRSEVALFEVGKGYRPEDRSARGEPREVHQLALVLARPAAAKGARFDALAHARLFGVVADLLAALGLEEPAWAQGSAVAPWAHPVRALVGDWGAGIDAPAILVAELEPAVARGLSLAGELASDVAVAQLSLDALLAAPRRPPGYRAVPRFPGVKVDVAVLAPEERSAGELAAIVREAGKGLVAQVELFDLFRGEQLGAGRKSLAWHVLLQSPSRTLSDQETQKFLARLERALAERGCELRKA